MEASKMDLLKMYWDEWKFRQEGLWKRIIQFSIVIFFTSTMPITARALNVEVPSVSLSVFPVAGIVLTVFFYWFCLCEASRINTIDAKIKWIISDLFSQKYSKTDLLPFSKKTVFLMPLLRSHMSLWVPALLSALHLFIAVFMLYVISTGKLPPLT